ncbi:MAG TPA: glycosyltransferase family 4 protein [Gammaproteobacteria bacterium]|nr:glycosyltransferase family 4 protein [Gammaproteobacteria bacterium]
MTTSPDNNKQTKPRVLLIANTAWYLRNFRARMVQRLEASGFMVILASPTDPITSTAFFRRRHFEPLRLSRKGRNPMVELVAIIGFIRLFRRVRPDIVLTWTPKPNIYGAIAARLLHIPAIPNVSGLGAVFIRGGAFPRLIGRLYRFAFSRAPVVFFQNEEDRNAFIAAGWVRAERTERLPGSGVDLEHFRPQPLPALGPFVFLFIGRLLADKGLRELVAAAEHLRSEGHRFVLRMAGYLDPGNPSGIGPQELERWVKTRNVEYLGSLEDVRPALNAAHCVVLPSYGEGVPKSLLEAAATSRPVITTDVPGCRDTLISEVSGFLCTPREMLSLAACMARMLDLTPRQLADMGYAGRVHVEEKFSEELVLEAYRLRCLTLQNRTLRVEHPLSDR